MKFILALLFLFNLNLYGQDCTMYDVTFIIKGTLNIDSNSTYEVQGPSIDYLRGYTNKKFDNDSTFFRALDKSFEVVLKRKMYDFYNFTYKRKVLPIIITVSDFNGKSKKTKLDIPLSNFEMKFEREGAKVNIEFELKELTI